MIFLVKNKLRLVCIFTGEIVSFQKYNNFVTQSHCLAVIMSKIIKSKIILRIANHPVGVKFFKINLVQHKTIYKI